MRDVSEAKLIPITEAEFAAANMAEGRKLAFRNGVYWEPVGARGFYQPLTLRRELSLAEAKPAIPWSWGSRALLRPGDARAANGILPVVHLPDVDTYDYSRLQPRRRTYLRQAEKRVRVVQVTDYGFLADHGFDVVIDALSRTKHQSPPTRDRYNAKIRAYERGRHWCVLAGLIDEKLGGYMEFFAVDGVAYFYNAYVASWALSTNLYTRLVYEYGMLCRRTEGIKIVMNGLDRPEKSSLMQFKKSLGYVVDYLPLYVDMAPMVNFALHRFLDRNKYYRLTGRGSPAIHAQVPDTRRKLEQSIN